MHEYILLLQYYILLFYYLTRLSRTAKTQVPIVMKILFLPHIVVGRHRILLSYFHVISPSAGGGTRWRRGPSEIPLENQQGPSFRDYIHRYSARIPVRNIKMLPSSRDEKKTTRLTLQRVYRVYGKEKHPMTAKTFEYNIRVLLLFYWYTQVVVFYRKTQVVI